MVIGSHYVLFALYATVFIFLVKFNLLSDHLGSSCSFAYHIDGSAQNYANSIFRNFTGDRKNFTVCLTLETSK